MDDFIQIAQDLKSKMPELLENYSNLGIVGFFCFIRNFVTQEGYSFI